MTNNEKEIFSKFSERMDYLSRCMTDFATKAEKDIKEISDKVDKKHMPIHFETDILTSIQQSMNKCIVEVMSGYSSPLSKLIKEVVDNYSSELKGIISSSFEKSIRTEEFKESILTAFSHKIAKSMIAGNDSLFDKVSNELKQDAVFKAKISIAISNIVEECMKGRSCGS